MIVTVKSGKQLVICEDNIVKWKKLLKSYRILYFYAMCGYGKTSQAEAFAQCSCSRCEIISATDKDFLGLIRHYTDTVGKSRYRTMLVLDDVQYLTDEKEREQLFELLVEITSEKPSVRVLILSRAELPAYLKPLLVKRLLMIQNSGDIALKSEQIRELIELEPVDEQLPKELKDGVEARLEKITRGHPVSCMSYYRRLMQSPFDEYTAYSVSLRDLWDYIDRNVMRHMNKDAQEALTVLGIFETFTISTAERVLNGRAEQYIKYWQQIGSFLLYKAPDRYTIVDAFAGFLRSRFELLQKERQREIYLAAGEGCEECRDFRQAFRFYKKAGAVDELIRLFIYLFADADGNQSARICAEYLDDIPEERIRDNPKLMGAISLLYAYQMNPVMSRCFYKRLVEIVERDSTGALAIAATEQILMLLFTNPCMNTIDISANLAFVYRRATEMGIRLERAVLSGNMPSMVNGSLDVLPWIREKDRMYRLSRDVIERFLPEGAKGSAEVMLGEFCYEQNRLSEAMHWLSAVYTHASADGNVSMQFAAGGVMMRVYQAEDQAEAAEHLLETVRDEAEAGRKVAIIPNVRACGVNCALLHNDITMCYQWLKTEAPDEFARFYINSRYQLLTKAKVYIALDRGLEALHILNILEDYSRQYRKEYFGLETDIFKSIVCFRRGEPWQERFISVVKRCRDYGTIRVLADHGAALLPLWQQIDWQKQKICDVFCNAAETEMKKMAVYYPDYLTLQAKNTVLSDREKMVLKLIAQGSSNAAIAEMMELSLGTVKFHISNIMKKFGAENRTVAVKMAQEEGLI